jgi:hypothetical protein
VRERTLAVYRSERDGRARLAVLVWQADDPRVTVAGEQPRLLVFTMDVEPEAGADNVVALAGFDSFEAARGRCIEWAGDPEEVGWDALGETGQIGVYASIREPGFAELG